MNNPYIVHIMVDDKFTRPIINELNKLFEPQQHHFLVLGQANNSMAKIDNTTFLKSPFRSNILQNLTTVAKHFYKAELIVMHGIPALHYFLLFPFALKKIAWIIYGGTDLYLYSGDTLNSKTVWLNRLRKFILKRVKIHLTHIQGDSKLANDFYRSNAKFIYHPVYLSNIIKLPLESPENNRISSQKLNVLLGHSTDPSNHHFEIFEWFKGMDNIQIYCPLSYGPYNDYKEKVKQKGVELFGERFLPIEHFMQFEEYKAFLETIDVAVFNHKRQEAMGVTLTLLSLGKEVYVNDNTTSFQSLKERGFQLFSNALITTERSKFATRNVDANASLLKRYYSKQVWEAQWKQVYNFNSIDEFA